MAGGIGGVSPLPGTAATVLVWRSRGRLQVTVIAKATFAFVPDGAMTKVAAEPIVPADAHHQDNWARSIRRSSDVAPPLARADVLFAGSAHAPPPGGASLSLPVRLAVFDGQRALMDKRLLCRDRAAFAHMPIVYERAAGGIGAPENPVGVARDDATVVDPTQPQRVAGFGPIARAWPARRRLLGSTPRQVLERPVVELPDAFDWAYFQAAPPDQQIEALRGDEWIILEGLHPTVPLLRTRLPEARGYAWIHGLAAAPQRQEMRADTLFVDGDAERCTLVWRTSFALPDEAALPALHVVATTTVAGEAPGDGRIPDVSDSGPAGSPNAAPSAASTGTLALPSSGNPGGTVALPSSSPSATLPIKPGAGAPAKPALPFTDAAHAPPASAAPAPEPRRPDPSRGSTMWLGGKPKSASTPLPFQPAAGAQPAAPPEAESQPEIPERPAPAATPAKEPEVAPPAMLGPLVATGTSPQPKAAPAPAEVKAAPAPAEVKAAPAAAKVVAAAPAKGAPGDLTIEQAAAIAAELAERRDPRDEVLARRGVGEADFVAADRRWREKIEKEAAHGAGRLRVVHDTAYLAAVEGLRGPITVGDYATVMMALERGTAYEALDALSIQRPALMPLVRVWTKKIASDPRLADEAGRLLASLRLDGA